LSVYRKRWKAIPADCDSRISLKLVRLAVPPLPQKAGSRWVRKDPPYVRDKDHGPSKAGHDRKIYFAGGAVIGPGAGSVVGFALGGAGASGLCFTGGGAGVPLTTDPLEPRCPIIDKASANSMNAAAKIVVAFVSRVAPDRAPNAA